MRGYTLANDMTARDLQKKDGQWTRAKGFDTFCAVGPVVSTKSIRRRAHGRDACQRRVATTRVDAGFYFFDSGVARLYHGSYYAWSGRSGADGDAGRSGTGKSRRSGGCGDCWAWGAIEQVWSGAESCLNGCNLSATLESKRAVHWSRARDAPRFLPLEEKCHRICSNNCASTRPS